MIVQCDRCKTKFRLDDSRIGPRGIKVRCSRCAHVFQVTTADEASLASASRIEAQLVDPTASERPMQPGELGAPRPPLTDDLVLDQGSSFLKGLSGGDIDWSHHPSQPPTRGGAAPASSLFGSWSPPAAAAGGVPSFGPPAIPHRAPPIERAETIREPRPAQGTRPPNGNKPVLPAFEPPSLRAELHPPPFAAQPAPPGPPAPRGPQPPPRQPPPVPQAAAQQQDPIKPPTFPPPPVFDPFSDPLTEQAFDTSKSLPPPERDPFEPSTKQEALRPAMEDPFSVNDLQHPQDFLAGGSAAMLFDPSRSGPELDDSGAPLAKIELKRGLLGLAGTPSVLGSANDVETRIAPSSGLVEPELEAEKPRSLTRTFVLLGVLISVLIAGLALEPPGAVRLDEPRIFEHLSKKKPSMLDAAIREVRPARARISLYPSEAGKPVLVVSGLASNQSGAEVPALEAVAFMLEGERIVGQRRAPVGALLPVDLLAKVRTEEDVEKLLAEAAARSAPEARPLAPGETREFMVVFPEFPSDLERYTFRVEFKPRAGLEAAGR